MSPERHERVCIVGTAQSWKQTPWNDIGLYIVSLNDAYRMKAFVRADAWYDFHPLHRFFHPVEGQPVFSHQVPPGSFVRPAGHLDWLAKQSATIPVWLHPDYLTQHPAAKDWPLARAIPRAELQARFGDYFTSSPAFMLAHAMTQGAKEVWITGIHLATEQEYVRQRPQFELMCGSFLGSGKRSMVIKDGFRHYETPDAHLVLPVDSPVLQAPAIYPFESHPDLALEPLKWDMHRFTVKKQRDLGLLRQAKWYQDTRPIKERITRWEAYLGDTQDQMSKLHVQQQFGDAHGL